MCVDNKQNRYWIAKSETLNGNSGWLTGVEPGGILVTYAGFKRPSLQPKVLVQLCRGALAIRCSLADKEDTRSHDIDAWHSYGDHKHTCLSYLVDMSRESAFNVVFILRSIKVACLILIKHSNISSWVDFLHPSSIRFIIRHTTNCRLTGLWREFPLSVFPNQKKNRICFNQYYTSRARITYRNQSLEGTQQRKPHQSTESQQLNWLAGEPASRQSWWG